MYLSFILFSINGRVKKKYDFEYIKSKENKPKCTLNGKFKNY